MSNNLTVFEKKEKRNYIAFQVKSFSRENDEGYSDSFKALDKYGIWCSDDTCEQQVSRDIDDFLEKTQYGRIMLFDESIEIKVPICEKCQSELEIFDIEEKKKEKIKDFLYNICQENRDFDWSFSHSSYYFFRKDGSKKVRFSDHDSNPENDFRSGKNDKEFVYGNDNFFEEYFEKFKKHILKMVE